MPVMVECYHDYALVQSLGIPSDSLIHSSGKGDVLRAMAKANGEAVGIVDEGFGKPAPREMDKYRETESVYGLRRMEHVNDSGKVLIVIIPRLEEWLRHRASCADIHVKEYGLPESPREFHRCPETLVCRHLNSGWAFRGAESPGRGNYRRT